MPNINERPVCHRAEDLVTFLYGEASEVDAKDFTQHLQQCDACRSEFGVFQQVHDSILLWRNEALGAAFSPTAVSIESTVDSTQFVQHERKLTALAALREFFSVSPLWLRTATAFATLLLCALAVLVISRSWNRPAQMASNDAETKYTRQQVDELVRVQVDKKVAELNGGKAVAKTPEAGRPDKPVEPGIRVAAVSHVQQKTPRPRGLSRQEREQLASDLRLVPRDDEELPLGLSDEPNQ